MASGFSQFNNFAYSSVLGPSQMMSSNCLQPGVHSANCDPVHARNILVDPQSGQSICTCQYERFMTAYRQYMLNGPLSGLDPSALLNNPPSNMPPSGPASLHPDRDGMQHSTHPALIRDPHNIYGEMKAEMPMDNGSMASWRAAMGMTLGMSALPPPGAGHYAPYDPSMGGGPLSYSSNPYCSNNYGMDPNGMNRRKNATRETTSQLKHWLYEHRKNPYPTKAEKIMLAILTKMTLTQVSTWFANARRRLKKENKMTWSPRNRGCEDDNDDKSEADHDQDDRELDLDKDDFSDTASLKDVLSPGSPPASSSLPPDGHLDNKAPNANGSENPVESQTCTSTHVNVNPTCPKPRIWSLADVAMDKPAACTTGPSAMSTPTPEAIHAYKSHMSTSSASFSRPMEQQMLRASFHPSFSNPYGPSSLAHLQQFPMAPSSHHGNPVLVPNPNSAFSAPLQTLSCPSFNSTPGKMSSIKSLPLHRLTSSPYTALESSTASAFQAKRQGEDPNKRSPPSARLNPPVSPKESRVSPVSKESLYTTSTSSSSCTIAPSSNDSSSLQKSQAPNSRCNVSSSSFDILTAEQ